MSLWGLLSGRGEQGMSWFGMPLFSGISRGLLDKRQFRAYREFTAATTIKFVAAKPFLLTAQTLYCDAGNAKATITTGGTEAGTFTAMATKFCKWLIGGPTVGSTTLSVGGTTSGGTEREVLRAASGAGVGILNSIGGTRALDAGTYYITIAVTGTTSGVYSLEWEELNTLS